MIVPFMLQNNGGGAPTFDLPLVNMNAGVFTLTPLNSTGSGTPTYTRATAATTIDFEGLLKTCLSGEVRCLGGRRVRNLCGSPSADSSAFTTTSNASVSGSTVTFSAAGGYALANGNITNPPTKAGTYTLSVTIQAGTKAGTVRFGNQTEAQYATITPTVTPTRYSHTFTAGGSFYFGLVNADANTGTVLATNWQLEDVTGQSNQFCSDYVSVGVLSAPVFHGAGVDGVAYFTYLNPWTVSGNVATDNS